jgi:tetratricopeptide (TPR) repeat protein
MEFCQAALALTVSRGGSKRQAQALQELAFLKASSGDFSGAKDTASESQRAAKIAGNLTMEAAALRAEAVSCQNLGIYHRCISLLDRATHLLNLSGISDGELHGGIRSSQAEVYRCKSEYAEARNIQINILQNSPADRTPYQHAFALLNIAQIDVEIGGTEDDVQESIAKSGLLFGGVNFSIGLTYCDIVRAAMDIQQHKFLAAETRFRKCLRSTWGKDPESVAYCLEKLASVPQWSPVHQITFSCTVTFLVHSVKYKQRLELHKALEFLGDIFQAQGDHETAVNLLLVALDGFTQMDVHRSRAECMVRLGDISKMKGDELKAAALWETARPLFERSSQIKQLAELNSKLASLHLNQSQEVQREAITCNTPKTEHLKLLSGAKSTDYTEIEVMENISVEDKKATVLVDTSF